MNSGGKGRGSIQPDFINTSTYNDRGALTQLVQQGVSGGNTVAYKRIELDYAAADQLDQLRRYASAGTSQLVASSSFTYDAAGRLATLRHAQGATIFADYGWTYDAANRVEQFTSSQDGAADYTYDDRGQLVAAEYDYQSNEDYAYDDNGNRTGGG